jgi:tartrate-resistant acid phosphatase type 5
MVYNEPMNTKANVALLLICSLLVLLAACAPPTSTPLPATSSPTPLPPSPTVVPASPTPTEAPTATPEPSPTLISSISFAVIGDFGEGNQAEADVASLIHSWNPDFILTVGDNNYPLGAASTIDARIGQYYHDFIFPYTGSYGPGASENHFFPTLGNHDWYTTGAKPYLDYFVLPGNERYYDFTWGPVHFFALDSDESEPDGVNQASRQAAWLKQAMAASTSRWNIVYFHHAPYSSGILHGSTTWMRWPFKDWGADAVLAGHEHNYERLLVDGLVYFVNGAGGGGLYNFGTPLPESQFRYNANYGAMQVSATGTDLHFGFYSRTGQLIDQSDVQKP